MKKSYFLYLFLSVTSIGLLVGCSTPRRSAPVVDMATQSGVSRPSIEAPSAPRAADERGFYTVKRGDTLARIAQEFNQNYRDLVIWNNLSNPNDIRVDQVLRVVPPTSGATAGGMSANSGVEVRPLNGSAAPAVGGSTITKVAPRGDKRPYSDATLAELQKGDAAVAATPPAAVVVRPDVPKTNDKQAETAVVNEDTPSFIWPSEGKVVSSFEEGKKGIDIAGKIGQPVLAAAAGKVMYAGSGIRGYGNLVIVKHNNSLLSAYAHNKVIVVKEGQQVGKGEKIAEMGNSGTDAVKLHFEIRQQSKPVDPAKFLPAK